VGIMERLVVAMHSIHAHFYLYTEFWHGAYCDLSFSVSSGTFSNRSPTNPTSAT
jgi:hypothetical protein